MDIRKIVKTRLKEVGRSQYWLAKEIGMTRQGVSAFFGGRNDMNAETLAKVLDALELDIVPRPSAGPSKKVGRHPAHSRTFRTARKATK